MAAMVELKSSAPFAIGDVVVYPLQGVGVIENLEERTFKGETVPYYVINIEAAEMIVRVPVDKVIEVGIRSIVSPKEAKEAIKIISSDLPAVPSDWKQRYNMNKELLKNGSLIDIATVVTKLYKRSRVKELPVMERNQYNSALKQLINEISHSLSKTPKESEEMIFCELEADD